MLNAANYLDYNTDDSRVIDIMFNYLFDKKRDTRNYISHMLYVANSCFVVVPVLENVLPPSLLEPRHPPDIHLAEILM